MKKTSKKNYQIYIIIFKFQQMSSKLSEVLKVYSEQVEDCATLRSKIAQKQTDLGRKGKWNFYNIYLQNRLMKK